MYLDKFAEKLHIRSTFYKLQYLALHYRYTWGMQKLIIIAALCGNACGWRKDIILHLSSQELRFNFLSLPFLQVRAKNFVEKLSGVLFEFKFFLL